MSACRFGGNGSDRRWGSALGVESRAEMKLGRSMLGAGWRVNAE